MNINRILIIMLLSGLIGGAAVGAEQKKKKEKAKNVVDEVAWVIGDEALFLSDIEEHYEQLQKEGQGVTGNPYCVIPEEMAVEKLYLHQAKLDTIEVQNSHVASVVDERLNFFITNLGSREKVEEYFHKSLPALREQLFEVIQSQFIVQQVQQNLTKDVVSTPNDVRKYFNNLEVDSIPYIPMQVEVQIITISPTIPQQEIEDIKAQLRDYTDRINSGKAEFSTLAIMYSEDPGSAMQGGELGFRGRADFVPEFSNVAFNLNDPKRVSRIVETEYGFHIIQLIDKRGDMVNVRHILRVPKVSRSDLEKSIMRLDTLQSQILNNEIPFEEAARFISQDKESRNNRGIMVNTQTGGTRFEMHQLPVEVARQIENMQPGDMSKAFVMKDVKKNKDMVAIVKLLSRTPGHRATLSDDYNTIKEMYLEQARQDILKNWVEKKIKETYVKIEDGWADCDFKYKGWIKE